MDIERERERERERETHRERERERERETSTTEYQDEATVIERDSERERECLVLDLISLWCSPGLLSLSLSHPYSLSLSLSMWFASPSGVRGVSLAFSFCLPHSLLSLGLFELESTISLVLCGLLVASLFVAFAC